MRTTLGIAACSLALLVGAAPSAAQQSAGTFTPTGNMTTARAEHTATLLLDGRVLITGGLGRGSGYVLPAERSAELYDPATGTFHATDSMIEPRANHTATLLTDGRVLIAGPEASSIVEVYDPASGRFFSTGGMFSPQSIQTATLLASGKVLVAGESHAELYDPATGIFLPAAPYAVQMNYYTATLLADGRVLFVGNGPAQIYDPARDAFSVSGSPVGRYLERHSATLLNNGKVLVAGGSNDEFPGGRVELAQLYDPATDAFSATSDLLSGRDGHAAVLLSDGKVLLVGGEGASCSQGICQFAGSLASAEIYDPATGSFSAAGNMSSPRSSPRATRLKNGDVLITGGLIYCEIGCVYGGVASAELYHPLSSAHATGPLSGLWWNANESGWGVHFTQRGNNVFAAWYTYDARGNPKWYVSTCALPNGTIGTIGICNGTVYEVSGPTFFGTSFNPALVNPVNAGALQVNFQSADNGSMTYSGIAGQTRTVAITRQPLSGGTAPPAINYTDIWWGGLAESGWGMAITQQFNTIFLAWYVYDATGKPMWYVATCTLNGTTCAGDLLRTTGPPFGATFDASQVHSFVAGTVSVDFTDGNNATLSYTVNRVSGTKNITRQLF
jgi:hypothetical protein